MAGLDPNAFARGMASVPQTDITAGARQQTANLMNMMRLKQSMDETRRADAVRNALAGITDYANVTPQQRAAVVAADPAMGLKLGELEDTALKRSVDRVSTALLPVLFDPSDEAITKAGTFLKGAGADTAQLDEMTGALLAAPTEKRPALLAGYIARSPTIAKALDMGLPKLEKRDDGKQEWMEDINPLSPGFGKQYSLVQLRESPDAALRANVDMARIKQDEAELAFRKTEGPKPVTQVVDKTLYEIVPGPGGRAYYREPTEAPPGGFPSAALPATPGAAPPAAPSAGTGAGAAPGAAPPAAPGEGGLTISQKKNRDRARNTLDVFGYNPETGQSELETLITQTASGVPQTIGSTAKSVFGIATPEAIALAKVEPMMKQVALATTDFKVGADVSNKDIEILKEQYGAFADTTKPIAVRLAAADTAMRKLVQIAKYAPRAAAAPSLPAPPADTGAVRKPSSKTPTPQQIEMLRANPSLRNYFDETFGAGAAAKVLGE